MIWNSYAFSLPRKAIPLCLILMSGFLSAWGMCGPQPSISSPVNGDIFCAGEVVNIYGPNLCPPNQISVMANGVSIPFNAITQTHLTIQIPDTMTITSVDIWIVKNSNSTDTVSLTIRPLPTVIYPYTNVCAIAQQPLMPQVWPPSPLIRFQTISGNAYADSLTGSIAINSGVSGPSEIEWYFPPCNYRDTITINVTQPSTANVTYDFPTYCKEYDTTASRSVQIFGQGSFSSTPAGLALNSTTGDVDVINSATGSYLVTFTPSITNCALPGTGQIEIVDFEDTLLYPLTIACQNDPPFGPIALPPHAGKYYSVPPGLAVDSATGLISPSVSVVDTYQVYYAVAHAVCPDTILVGNLVEITQSDTSTLNYGDTIFCMSSGQNISPTWPLPSAGGTYSGDSGLVLLPNGVIDVQNSTPGEHTITYVPPPSACADPAYFTLELREHDIDFHYVENSICVCAGPISPVATNLSSGYFFSDNQLNINSASGMIQPDSLSLGWHYIHYVVADSICRDTFWNVDSILITGKLDASFTLLTTDTCENHGSLPAAAPAHIAPGAYYSVNIPGLDMHPNTGVIDLDASQPGVYTITRHLPQPCPCSWSTQFEVKPEQQAAFYYDKDDYCQNESNPAPVWLPGTTTGGTFTASSGVSINTASGVIDLQNSILGTSFQVMYETPGPCKTFWTDSLIITPAPDAAFRYDESPITNSDSRFCFGDVIRFDSLFTPSDTGDFSAIPTILQPGLDPTTGVLTISEIPPGDYQIIHNVDHNVVGGCPDQHSVNITVHPFDSTTTFIYPHEMYWNEDLDSIICERPDSLLPLFLVGNDSAGRFSRVSGTASFNQNSGNISLNDPGKTVIRYEDYGFCNEVTQAILVVKEKDNPQFEYDTTKYCLNGSNPQLLGLPTPPGGVFWMTDDDSAGITIDSASGEIFLQGNEAANLTVFYTTAAPCLDTGERNVELRVYPDVHLDAFEQRICDGDNVSITGDRIVEFEIWDVEGNVIPFPSASLTTTSFADRDSIAVFFENVNGCRNDTGFVMSVATYAFPDIDSSISVFSKEKARIELKPNTQDTVKFVCKGQTTNGEFVGAADTTITVWNGESGWLIPVVAAHSDYVPVTVTYDIISITGKVDIECPGDTIERTLEIFPPREKIFVPGVFTPNDDKFNDVWEIEWDRENIKPEEWEILVFNRAGGLVYHLARIDIEWDGAGLPDGVYKYVLRRSDSKRIAKKGGLTIRRR